MVETVPETGVESRHADWRFLRKPFWVFSHIFAVTVVVSFVGLGFWQLDRLAERRDANQLIESRLSETIVLDSAPAAGPGGASLDYQSVRATVRFVDDDFVRVVNRSQGGVAGEHVIAIVELVDGSPLAVNRGFVPSNVEVELDPVPDGPTELTGWLRRTVTRGSIGATDSGAGTRLPRLDTERVAERLGRPLPEVALQVAPDGDTGLASFPDPVPLPPVDDGPHRSYAVQWFTFATLGVLFYLALLWRHSTGRNEAAEATAVPAPEPPPAAGSAVGADR